MSGVWRTRQGRRALDKSKKERFFDLVNLPLLFFAAALVAYGSVMVWSATSGMAGGDGLFKRHLVGLAVGLVPLGAAWLVDYKALRHWSGPLMTLLGFLLISPRIPGLGTTAKGATSWLQIAGVRLFQPSEPGKLVFIVVMAAIISEYEGRIDRPRDMWRVLGYLGGALGLILLQPDLGTGMVFVGITLAMLLLGGLETKRFVLIAVMIVVLVVAVFVVDGTLDRIAGKDVALKQYQKDRLLVFLDPTRDPQGAGYNLQQSKIAVGSGGITGKGLRAGTQSNLHFLPERHTDFIFAVLGEELGFVGAVVLLGLYVGLLFSALSIAASSRDLYGALVCAGIIGMWGFQVLENIGMTIGMMPITGIPLPFMSFGSSAMVTNLGAVGLLQSVWSRRYGT
ncbi:MAG: rod shape-determining protein RodA [Anaerosomatales bacterium]|nr:rod shape-determining protein RodA [Coriobacteriia bacterium]MDI6692835.1 rod shape-determining protein RodA [Anaerosomatales bacterium]